MKRILRTGLAALLLATTAQAQQPDPSQPVEKADCPPDFDWAKVPPIPVFPRPGNFNIQPKGPGYYSLLDVLEGNERKAPPKMPYGNFGLFPPPLYNADFRYLENPKNTQHDFFDPLHRLHLGENWLFNTGGQTWWRHMHDTGTRLNGIKNDYDLWRVRVFGDLWYRDDFRVYVEFIDAQSFNQDLPPLAIDRNFGDLLNAFADVKLAEIDGHNAYLRVGRQEMLFGSQRLISPPDWANNRRTFDGLRFFRQGEKWDVDFFWVSPVINIANRFDSHDNNQNFFGAWTTYRPEKGHFLDFYYLWLDNTNNVVQQGINLAPFNVHTLGSRYVGDKNQWLWDVEAMAQFGENGSAGTLAGAFTTGFGYNFASLPMNPTAWVYYDYASGDHSPGSGNFGTFNQLFPFGHYYMGWADSIGRQNIQDINAHLYLFPTKWITFWAQYHHFMLAQSKDALYNVAGNAVRRDPTGAAGNDVGNEVDLILSFQLGAHSNVLVGWSKLFAGPFIEQTGSPKSPELFYAQYSFRW